MEAEVQAQEGRAVIHSLFLLAVSLGNGITVMEAEQLQGLLSAIWGLRKAIRQTVQPFLPFGLCLGLQSVEWLFL